MNKVIKVTCPGCQEIFSYYESIFRPFCSERCKQIDLGHWFTESYRVPEKTPEPAADLNESKEDFEWEKDGDEYE